MCTAHCLRLPWPLLPGLWLNVKGKVHGNPKRLVEGLLFEILTTVIPNILHSLITIPRNIHLSPHFTPLQWDPTKCRWKLLVHAHRSQRQWKGSCICCTGYVAMSTSYLLLILIRWFVQKIEALTRRLEDKDAHIHHLETVGCPSLLVLDARHPHVVEPLPNQGRAQLWALLRYTLKSTQVSPQWTHTTGWTL